MSFVVSSDPLVSCQGILPDSSSCPWQGYNKGIKPILCLSCQAHAGLRHIKELIEQVGSLPGVLAQTRAPIRLEALEDEVKQADDEHRQTAFKRPLWTSARLLQDLEEASTLALQEQRNLLQWAERLLDDAEYFNGGEACQLIEVLYTLDPCRDQDSDRKIFPWLSDEDWEDSIEGTDASRIQSRLSYLDRTATESSKIATRRNSTVTQKRITGRSAEKREKDRQERLVARGGAPRRN